MVGQGFVRSLGQPGGNTTGVTLLALTASGKKFLWRRCPGSAEVTKGLAKTIRAMADGTLDSQVGARICNGLGIMRACLETQKLEQLEARMNEIADRVARDRTNAARERTSHP
jgi:hypothetical protein